MTDSLTATDAEDPGTSLAALDFQVLPYESRYREDSSCL